MFRERVQIERDDCAGRQEVDSPHASLRIVVCFLNRANSRRLCERAATDATTQCLMYYISSARLRYIRSFCSISRWISSGRLCSAECNRNISTGYSLPQSTEGQAHHLGKDPWSAKARRFPSVYRGGDCSSRLGRACGGSLQQVPVRELRSCL